MRWSIVLVLAASGAAAAQPRARLIVDGDACPLADVGARVTELLGRDPFTADARALVRIEVARDGAGARANVTLVDADGTVTGPRALAAADCAALAADLPIVIATVVRSLPLPPPVPLPPPPVIAGERDDEHLDAAPSPARPAGGTSLAILVGVGVGQQVEEVAGLRVRRGRGSLLVEARRAGAEEVEVIRGEAGIEIVPAAIDLVPCVHAGSLSACGVMSAGWLAGSSRGLVHVDSARLPLVAAGARVGAEYHLTAHVGLALRAELRAVVTHAEFQVDHMTVWTSPRFEAGVGIDLFAQIP